MNLLLSALTLTAALPLVASRLPRRPITDLDRRLSAVDVELDARRG